VARKPECNPATAASACAIAAPCSPGDGARLRDGQDEGQQQRGRRAREHRADDACEEHPERDEGHRRSRQPGVPRGEGAEADEGGARDGERGLGLQPLAHGTAEVDEQQHRERAEGGEGGKLGVAEALVADREERRHEDRRPGGPTQDREPGVVRGEPVQRVRHLAGRFYAGRPAASGGRDAVSGEGLRAGSEGKPARQLGRRPSNEGVFR
jgi:hypothetical protein